MEQKDKKQLVKALIGVGVLLLLILIIKPQNYIRIADNSPAEKKSEDLSQYEWQDDGGIEKYKDVVWKKITEGRLNGFISLGNVVAEKEVACYWSDEPCYSLISKENEYLRVEGGLANSYYFLAIVRNGEPQTIKSLEKLKKFFAPVDNEVEAMSFVGVTENDLQSRLNNGDYILVGETAVIDDGFLVKVVKNNTFGCGRHDPQKVIFKITRAGEIMMTAIEILPPPSEYDLGTCVD